MEINENLETMQLAETDASDTTSWKDAFSQRIENMSLDELREARDVLTSFDDAGEDTPPQERTLVKRLTR